MGPNPAYEEMRPPHLASSPLGGNTVAETPSRRQGTGGPNPSDIIAPPGYQGDGPRPLGSSALDDLLLLPMRFGDLAREVGRLCNFLQNVFARVAWDTIVPSVDVTGTSDGASGSYVKVFPARSGYGVEMRNVQVGMNAAGVVQVVAIRSDALYATGPKRILAVVRTTANQLTQLVTSDLHLEPDETLYAWCSSASNHFDFCGEFRARRSE